ncbi:MAG: D-alanyl-D-alanine carboxypeptidase [Firmicutes bacterium]|nr:D-alanyl-D-alanine carboxypeptidase [Bacillota bacterium]
MKKIVVCFVLAILAFTLFLPNYSLASPNISSPKAVLIDGKTGQVLYSKNADERSFPASTTKIMTAVLALERGNLKDYVPISKKASFIDGSRIYLLEGEDVTLEQLLYGLILDSANDAAIAIAEHIGGSVEEFAVMMNDKARELGALNTNFTNPNGLPDPNHVTTAYDMAIIAKHAMSIPKFREIVSTVSYIIPETNMQDTRYLYNGNKLIKNTPYKYDGANGIKTGYTLAARQCFVGSAERDGMELITVILNENNTNAIWENTIALLDYGFNNFAPVPLVKKNQVIDEIEVKGSIKKIALVSERDFHYDAPVGETPEIDERIILNDKIVPPIHRGERLGYIEYSIGSETIGRVRLVAGEVPEDPVKASGVVVGGKSKTGSLVLWTFFLLLFGGSILTLKRKRRRKKNMYSYRNNIFRKK